MNTTTTETQDFVGFGSAELGFLLAQFEGQSIERVLEALEVSVAEMSDDVLRAGASSLFARGLLMHSAEGVVPEGGASVLSYAAATAVTCIRMGFMASQDETLDAAIVVHAPDADVVLQPRNFGSWVMLMKDPALSTGDACIALVEGFLDTVPDGAVFIAATGEWGEATLFVRHSASEWELALGESSLWAETPARAASREEVLSHIDRLARVG